MTVAELSREVFLVDSQTPLSPRIDSYGDGPVSGPIIRPVDLHHSPAQAVGPGTVLGGKWRLLSTLGEGGTATVYLAEDPSGSRVAVKVLRSDMGRDPLMRARFSREVNVPNTFQHPSVVSVLGDGAADDGSLYMVMELLSGETLDARWERKGRKLPVREVLWAADKLLDVLAVAHEKGVLHRDVKPENLFLTDDRRLKVLDFGIARMRGLESELGKTQIGVVMGTPGFMAPEQARGQWDEVAVQTDLWSVGATMYALLAGQLVHASNDIAEAILRASSQPARSLATVAPDVPEAIVDLVDIALSFEKSNRWANARSMQRAVRRADLLLARGPSMPDSDDGLPSPVSAPNWDHELEAPPLTYRPGALPVPSASTSAAVTIVAPGSRSDADRPARLEKTGGHPIADEATVLTGGRKRKAAIRQGVQLAITFVVVLAVCLALLFGVARLLR